MNKPAQGIWIHKPETSEIVNEAGTEICGFIRNDADGAYIVKCVNLHEELVELLRRGYDANGFNHLPEVRKRVRELLAKAEGK